MLPRETGLTLVDTAIAAVVVALVIGLAYPGFQVANDTMSTSGMRDRAERAGDRILKELTEAIRPGFIVDASAPSAAPFLTVALPRQEVPLQELTASGGIPWSDDQRTIRYRQLETVSESGLGEDLNDDGDREDQFSLGLIELVEGETARPITNTGRVMLALPDYRGDLDGDGQGDPLFTVDGRNVEIRILMATRTDRGRFLTTWIRGGLRLRNAQE